MSVTMLVAMNAINKFGLNILLSITNKMQRYTVFFIAVNALHVSGGLSAHHQELKTLYTASGVCQAFCCYR
jgi:3,4-dihydroxy-2-butanone 4-phosphate synthase